MKKVIILGGGFAGVQAAIELAKHNDKYDVTLISNRDYFYLFPISIWVPTNSIKFEDVKVSLEKISKVNKFNFIQDELTSISSSENIVTTKQSSFTYDYLIVAIGSDKTQHAGIENTLSICGKPETSIEIKNKLEELVQKGKGKIAIGFGGNPKDSSAVRGGPAFELAFNIDNYLKKKRIRNKFELNFFAPMSEPGARMGKRAMNMANSMLDNSGIKKYFGKKISLFSETGVVFEDDSKLDSDLTLFIPASSGNKILQNSDLQLNDAGFIKIDNNCLVNGTNNVFAIGDAAALEGPDWKAKQGHTAEVMARIAVKNIYSIEDKTPIGNGYKEHLNIICIMDTGNGAAVIFRDAKREFAVPLPIIGHYLKKLWGKYASLTKLKRIPRIPGM